MTTLELPAPPLAIPADDLFDLQLKIARRADQLAHGAESSNRGRDLLLWFQAEREIAPQFEDARRVVTEV